MRFILTSFLCLCCIIGINGQDYTYQSFKYTRIINMQSLETLPGKTLEVQIGHRFGDLVGDNGGWQTFYGLENAADILLGLEYGLSDRFSIGLNRTKGSGPLKRLLNGTAKYRLIRQQKDNSPPLSITLFGMASYSTMEKGDNPELLNFFEKSSHRMIYHASLIFGKKFSNNFSFQVVPAYTHRNNVPFDDENGIFSVGAAARIQISKIYGIIADFTYPFSDLRTAENGYYPAFGIGLEIETGGHVFQINLTNATAMAETDYIPHTRSSWGDSQFRLGFTISRMFNL